MHEQVCRVPIPLDISLDEAHDATGSYLLHSLVLDVGPAHGPDFAFPLVPFVVPDLVPHKLLRSSSALEGGIRCIMGDPIVYWEAGQGATKGGVYGY